MTTLALLPSAYGGVPLDLAVISTTAGRSLVVHELSRGNLPNIQDRGLTVDRTRCDVLFVDREGLDTPNARYNAVRNLVIEGKPQLFRHPLHGSYLARVEGFELQLDGDENEIHVSCEFIAVDSPSLTVSLLTKGSPQSSSVNAAVDTASSLIEPYGGEAPGLAAAKKSADDWSQGTPSPRQVQLQLEGTLSQLQNDARELSLASDITRWEAYKAFIGVQRSLRETAITFTSTTEGTFQLDVRKTTPLRALVAAVYGARDAEARLLHVLALNDLDSPSVVEAGQTLIMPSTRGKPR